MTHYNMERIGENVRHYREHLGLTAKQLAIRSGISHRSILYYESGSRTPSLIAFARICDALWMSMDDVAIRPRMDLWGETAVSHARKIQESHLKEKKLLNDKI